MNKDPAILWYFDAYLSATEAMTFEEQGAYMRLLCHQMRCGHLSLKYIQRILGGDFARLWPEIEGKFDLDEEGLYFNQRVDVEKERRRKFINKQREVGKKGGRPKKPTENPGETQGFSETNPGVSFGETNYKNENINEDRDLSKESRVAKSKEEVSLVAVESSITGVEVGSKKSKKGKAKTFKTYTAEEFRAEVLLYRDRYPPAMLEDFLRYWSEPDERDRMRFQKQDTWSTPGRLVTWYNNNKNKFYGPHFQTPAPGADPKPGTSQARIDALKQW